jgi:hypothetical protein
MEEVAISAVIGSDVGSVKKFHQAAVQGTAQRRTIQ